MASPYELPDEALQSLLRDRYPCREKQVKTLTTLLDPRCAPCRNLVVYGTEATGKSAIVNALLGRLAAREDGAHRLRYAVVDSVECVTGRHLFERAVAKVAEQMRWGPGLGRCENLSQFTFELSRILNSSSNEAAGGRFVLVFDGIDRQREAPPTFLSALARLSEIIPSLTTVFIVTCPPPGFLRAPFAPHVHFSNYTKPEFVAILSATPPPTLPTATSEETLALWTRFVAAVHDALTRAASRTLPAFQDACKALWPRFTAPIAAGTHGPREFSKLMVAARVHFQDESLLDRGIIVMSKKPAVSGAKETAAARAAAPKPQPPTPSAPDLAALLPPVARLLLLAAYLASHNAARHDLTLFSTFHHGRRKRRGGGLAVAGGVPGRRGPRSKHRKIARKLLGAHAFVLERMLAIFTAVRSEWGMAESDAGIDTDVMMAIATLSTLRLLVRVGGGDPLDRGGKWRIGVGWEVVRGLGRSMGVEIEEWLID